MEYKCDLISDEIWDRARAGESLPGETVEHIAACPRCRRAADEAASIVPMVRLAASCVPQAPDCRSAVMDRISPRPVWRSAWALAAASVLLVAAVVTGWLAVDSGGSRPQMAVEPKQEIRQEAPKPEPPPVVTPEAPEPKPTPASAVEKSPKIERSKRIHLLPKQMPTQLVKRVAPEQEPIEHQTSAVPEPEEVVTFDDEPVAAVAVSWPTVGDQVMPASYGYTNRDASTGEVTFCRVERSDNAVTIHLESNAPGELPGKGA